MIPQHSGRLHGGRVDGRGGGWMKRREFLVATLGGVGGIAASSALRGLGWAAGAPRKGGQVIVGLSQEPTVFNPLKAHIEVDRGVHMCIFDALWRMNAQGQF